MQGVSSRSKAAVDIDTKVRERACALICLSDRRQRIIAAGQQPGHGVAAHQGRSLGGGWRLLAFPHPSDRRTCNAAGSRSFQYGSLAPEPKTAADASSGPG